MSFNPFDDWEEKLESPPPIPPRPAVAASAPASPPSIPPRPSNLPSPASIPPPAPLRTPSAPPASPSSVGDAAATPQRGPQPQPQSPPHPHSKPSAAPAPYRQGQLALIIREATCQPSWQSLNASSTYVKLHLEGVPAMDCKTHTSDSTRSSAGVHHYGDKRLVFNLEGAHLTDGSIRLSVKTGAPGFRRCLATATVDVALLTRADRSPTLLYHFTLPLHAGADGGGFVDGKLAFQSHWRPGVLPPSEGVVEKVGRVVKPMVPVGKAAVKVTQAVLSAAGGGGGGGGGGALPISGAGLALVTAGAAVGLQRAQQQRAAPRPAARPVSVDPIAAYAAESRRKLAELQQQASARRNAAVQTAPSPAQQQRQSSPAMNNLNATLEQTRQLTLLNCQRQQNSRMAAQARKM